MLAQVKDMRVLVLLLCRNILHPNHLVQSCVKKKLLHEIYTFRMLATVRFQYSTIIRQRRSEYFEFNEPGENNCFNIITQMIIRATEFSSILFFYSS